MSEYSRHLSWISRCSTGSSYGMTAGDTFYLGLQSYDQPYPCPNGLGIDDRPFQEFDWYKKRLQKAKKFIGDWNDELRIRSVADSITDEEILLEIETIRQWQHLQNQALQQTGFHASTQAEAS